MGETKPGEVVEQIPSVNGGVSAIGSMAAPFVFFDVVATGGCHGGIVNITLEARRYLNVAGTDMADRVIVAHLRTGLAGAVALAKLLESIFLLETTTAGNAD